MTVDEETFGGASTHEHGWKSVRHISRLAKRIDILFEESRDC